MSKIGVGILLLYRGKLGLILRDNNPNISWPNTWALPGGGQDPGENLPQTIRRELREELSIEPVVILLGVSPRDNGIFFSHPSDQRVEKIRKNGEGQDFKFFSADEIDKLDLGGEIRILFREYRDEIKQMITSGQVPPACKLGLRPWEGQ